MGYVRHAWCKIQQLIRLQEEEEEEGKREDKMVT